MKRRDEPVYQLLSALSLEYPSGYSHHGCNNWHCKKGIVSIVKGKKKEKEKEKEKGDGK